jgi:hypothetical protein
VVVDAAITGRDMRDRGKRCVLQCPLLVCECLTASSRTIRICFTFRSFFRCLPHEETDCQAKKLVLTSKKKFSENRFAWHVNEKRDLFSPHAILFPPEDSLSGFSLSLISLRDRPEYHTQCHIVCVHLSFDTIFGPQMQQVYGVSYPCTSYERDVNWNTSPPDVSLEQMPGMAVPEKTISYFRCPDHKVGRDIMLA